LVVLFTIAGGFVVYANTAPTFVTLNLRDGQANVPIDAQLDFKFSRPVALDTFQSALTVTPKTEGTLRALSGQTEFAWAPTGFLAQLTTYKVTIDSLTDLGHHQMKATEWTFTTNIQPRVTSVTSGGATIADGVEIDPGAPLQINFNDAMDHTTINVTAGTKVVTAVHPEGLLVRVSVTDDGPGVPVALQPKIFERFTRGDDARVRANGSTGLGLSIVAAVGQAHGGRVEVSSRPGATTFSVLLPAT
jgi:hypothetical protein